jgi:LCP family protein required for cell wall assembly
MRTTLKRGIGQAAVLNGNGHSAVAPFFGPIARYRQPDPPRRSVIGLILRGFGWLVLAAAVIGTGAAGGLYLYTHESLAEISNSGPGTGIVQQHLAPVDSPDQPAIALVAGYDVRAADKGSGSNPYAGSNSDTLMLLRADPKTNTLSLLSFPRDLYVNVYCHGDVVDTQDRINSAWQLCSNGPAATLDTVEHLTHLPINYLITLDFHAFKQLVNNLHGVYMNVDRRYYIPLHTGTSAINLQPGYQKLDGGESLSYVRYRHTDSDIYRTGRQQLFIDALKSRLRTSLSLSKLPLEVPKLVRVLKDNIKVVKAGGQAVDLGELTKYLGLIYNLPPGHMFRNAIPLHDFHYFVTSAGADVETAPASSIAAAVQSFQHPDVREVQAVNAQFGGKPKTSKKTKKQPKLPKSQVSVLVLNGSSVAGEAANTTYQLTTRGYATKALPSGDQANAPKVQRNTVIFYDPAQASGLEAAQQLRPLFGPHTRIVQMTTAISGISSQAGNPLTVVAVGTSFPGRLVFHRAPKVQPKKPPKVSDGAAMTAPRLRGVYDEVHFPLMVPHKIAQGSALAEQAPVRAFKPLKNQHEVALTFNMPGTPEYWQIEESTWNSAPILQNPSFTLVHRGQKYLVYTTGGAIQRVALRTPTATYWVQNTILNELSNSTMIAIAESFRPLRR